MGKILKGVAAAFSAVALPLTMGLGSPAVAADSDGDGIPNKFEQADWWNTPNNYNGGIQRWTDKNFPTACNNDTTLPAFQAVLVYPNGEAPDVDTLDEKKEFRRIVSRAESIFGASTERVLNTMDDVRQSRAPRWTTFVEKGSGKCAPILGKESIPAAKFPHSSSDWTATDFWNYMETERGKNDPDRKYVYFMQNYDDMDYAGVAQSTSWDDTNKSFSNRSNDMTHMLVYSPPLMTGFWGNEEDGKLRSEVLAHEIGHSIGMVGDNSPDENPNNSAHSLDCWEVMCYPAISSPNQHYDTGCGPKSDDNNRHSYRFDCNDDGTWNVNDPQSGYLSTHWNPTDNRFLWGGELSGAGASARTQMPGPDFPVIHD